MSRILRPRLGQIRQYATVQIPSAIAPPGTVNLTFAVRAGSRYETKSGLAHVLKSFAFKSTGSASALKIAREAELYGAQLSAKLTREHLLLSASFLRGDESRFLPLMASVLSSTQYYPHEYNELVLPLLQTEMMAVNSSPVTQAIEALHQVAFRKGLGNSLYAVPSNPISVPEVRAFAQYAFAKSNMTLISNGVSEDQIRSALGSGGSELGELPFDDESASYYGGEARIRALPGQRPTMVIGLGEAWEPSAACRVLAQLLGGSPSVKWGEGTGMLQTLGLDEGVTVETRLFGYSDASLLTIILTADDSATLSDAGEAVAQFLTEGVEITENDVEGAKQRARLELETRKETLEGQVDQALNSFGTNIEDVDGDDVVTAMNTFLEEKISVAVVGDLDQIAYADDMGFNDDPTDASLVD